MPSRHVLAITSDLPQCQVKHVALLSSEVYATGTVSLCVAQPDVSKTVMRLATSVSVTLLENFWSFGGTSAPLMLTFAVEVLLPTTLPLTVTEDAETVVPS
jgi:hypothetical protein